MKFDIFLSYSYLDRNIATELEKKFTASGLRCFLSEKSLQSGTEWVKEIRESIRASERILLLITPRSVHSKWIFIEAGAAWMEDKTIVPLIQFVDIAELPEVIKNVQIKTIETEAQKLELIHELSNLEGKSDSIEITLEFIIDKVRLAKFKMDQDRFQPNLFIGIGRGGAICAAVFAHHFGHHPLKVVDCQFAGTGNDRITKIDDSSLRKEDILDKNVLIVEWARQTGKTYQLTKERLSMLSPATIQSYALFWTRSNVKSPPDYYGIPCESVPSNPWGIY